MHHLRHRSPPLVLVAALGAIALAPAACAPEDDKDLVNQPVGTGGAGGTVIARFELPASGAPAFLAVPFPSDLYRDKAGLLTLPPVDDFLSNGGPLLLGGFKGLDGFGSTAGALFEIDDLEADGAAPAIDPATLPADEAASVAPGATAMIVDLDPADPAKALVQARAEYHDDSALPKSKLRPLLAIYPGRGQVLEPGHTYAAVITTGITAKGGKAIAASDSFRAIAGGKRDTDGEKLYGGAVDKVSTLVPDLKDKTKIAGLAVFTTSTNRSELGDLRGQLAKAHETAPPKLAWDAASLMPMGIGLFASGDVLPVGYTALLKDWLGKPDKLMPAGVDDDPADDQPNGRAFDAIGGIGTAVFDAPNFLLEKPTGYNDAEHQTFARDAMGKPIVNAAKPTSKIWVTIALPKITAMPGAGFPAVIVQHGLGGSRSFLLALANTFAKKGWATVAIDSVTHGARAASAEFTVDAKSGFAWSGSASAPYDGPDGLTDKENGPTDFFGSLTNIGALRDHFRQSVLDIGTLADVLRDPAVLDGSPLTAAAGAVPLGKLDPTKIVYHGVSLGGIMGAMFAAVEPHITTYVLNVPGGGLLTELPNGPIIGGFLDQVGALYGTGKARFAPGHPLMQLMQHVADVGDPLVYAKNITLEPLTLNGSPNPKKNVLQIEALWDEWVSNESNEALAFAAGFPLVEPSTGPRTKVALGSAMPDGDGLVSGVPSAGVTAVIVQAGPATHGANLYKRNGQHTHAYPWPRFDEEIPFPLLPKAIEVAEPYVAWQQAMVDFIDSSFAGVPTLRGPAAPVPGFPAPKLDFDGDGELDAADPDPNDPAK